MTKDLRYRKLISFMTIAFVLLPFALCLVNNVQAETIKYIYDDVNRVLRVETGGGTASITANAGNGGLITPSGVVGVKLGDSQTFMISPDSNYHIADVKVDNNSVGSVTSYTFTNVTGNHTIEATFVINTNQLTVSLSDPVGGSVTSAPAGINCGTLCSYVFNYGTEIILTAAPNIGYGFTGWSGACSGTGSCSVIADSEKSITANFAKHGYVIVSSINVYGRGTISPTGNILVLGGGSQMFTISSNAGYQTDVIVDGVSVGAVQTYTFSNVVADHTITANFSCGSWPVRIAGAIPTYYSSIQAAYDAAVEGDVIQSHAIKFSGNVNFSRAIAVSLEGGYNCDYSSVVGVTSVKGMLTVTDGKVTIKDFVLIMEIAPPITTASPSGGVYNGTQNVTLTCIDGNGSSCDKIYYTTDSSIPTTASSIYTGPINISNSATLRYFGKDFNNNSEEIKTQVYTIDTQLPTGLIAINNGASNTNNINVTLSLTCTDQNVCSQMQFSNDNANWSTPETFAATKSWTLAINDGVKTVYAKFGDTVGNWSNPYAATILLDTTAPVTSASLQEGTYNKAQIVTLSCSDGTGAGCDKIYYTVDGTTPTTSSAVYTWAFYISQTTTLKYFTADIAGNYETVKTLTYTINPNIISINGTPYSSLQAAYDAAQNGDVIKVQTTIFDENLNVNRNIFVTLDGGYDSSYTAKVGNTTLKGIIQTQPNGGVITIKNFIISN